MNVQSVNSQVANTGVSNSSKEQDSLLTLGKKGDEIEGIITKVADQISINFNGKEVTIPKSSVQGAKEGITKKFKIMDISATSVKLKEVGVGKESAKAIQAYCTKVETDQAAFAKRIEEASKEKKEETDQDLEDTANRMTADDSEKLEEEGYDYRKFELERLEQALTRVKEQREQKAEGIEKQIKNNKQIIEDVKKIAQHVLKSSPYAEQIIKKLEDSNLPVTESNIKNILIAMQQSESIQSLSDSSISYLIGNDLDITLGNLYKASYSSYKKNTSKVSDSDFQDIIKQVDNVIKKSGYVVNEETRDQARWILDNDLPLTEGTFRKLNQLEELRKNFNQTNVLDQVVITLEQGGTVEGTPLINNHVYRTQQILEDINQISDEAIHRVVKEHEQKDVTIALLKKEQETIDHEQEQQKTEGIAKIEQVSDRIDQKIGKSEVAATTQVDIEAIKTRRQLEEIRLKMTEDSVTKMTAKGIKIDTTSIHKVVEELRKIEDDYYRNLLQETGTKQTDENLSILKETTSKINDLKWMPSNLLADTFANRANSTINSLHEAGVSSQAKFAAINESYEALMTSPRQDMGDSIHKAFKNSMSDILAGLSLDDTMTNQRAVRMLGYNGMEITSENVAMMKEYDQKVNYLLNNLTPSVTMEFIKNDKNPVNMPIDELNNEIEQSRKHNGLSDEDGYARYLWKLEQQDSISERERDAYIGIYRLLHNVEKTDGAAIGSLARTGKEITLGNLLGEVRTKRAGRIDKEIDDSFGMLSQVTYKSKTITEQIENGFSSASTNSRNKQGSTETNPSNVQYNQMLLKDILSNITPSQVEKVLTNDNWTDMSLEKLKETLDTVEEDKNIKNEFYNSQVDELRELAKNSNEAIQFLSEHDMPVSIQNILKAQILLNPSSKLYKQLLDSNRENTQEVDQDINSSIEDALQDISDSVGDKDKLLGSIDKFAGLADGIIEHEMEDNEITSSKINDLSLLRGAIRLSTSLSKSEHYEIPIMVGESITNISLTVMSKSNQQDSKISMSVQSERYGKIEAEVRINERNSKALILCEDDKTSEAIKESIPEITQSMKDQKLNLVQLDIGVENIKEHSYIANSKSKSNIHEKAEGKVEDKATTKELYQVAKSFVILVKKLEASQS